MKKKIIFILSVLIVLSIIAVSIILIEQASIKNQVEDAVIERMGGNTTYYVKIEKCKGNQNDNGETYYMVWYANSSGDTRFAIVTYKDGNIQIHEMR